MSLALSRNVFLLVISLTNVVALSLEPTAEALERVYGLPTQEYAKQMLDAIRMLKFDKRDNYTKPIYGTEWSCPAISPSPTPPTSVHSLRPIDISVIGAIGDSLSAGFGAESTNIFNFEKWLEYRGIAFSAGGQESVETVVTLPNILKKFNPTLKGFATGSTQNKIGPLDFTNAHLNQARSGAKADDLPVSTTFGWHGEAYNWTVEAKAQLSASEFQNSWKLLTLFIGGNNQCWACNCEKCNITRHDPVAFVNEVKSTLDYLKANVPRLLVSLVLPANVMAILEVAEGSCKQFHSWACPCAASNDPALRQSVIDHTKAYRDGLTELAKQPEYQGETFTVVVQPFLVNTEPPRKSNGKGDASYFAPDCFHFSPKAHAAAATGLWDNLIEPVTSKDTKWSLGEPITCPSATQLICTAKNAGKSGC